MANPQASYNTLPPHPRPGGGNNNTSITNPLGHLPHLRASEWPVNEEPHAIRWFSELRKATFSILCRYASLVIEVIHVLREPGLDPSFENYDDDLREHFKKIRAGWRHFTSVEDITMDFFKTTFCFMTGELQLTARYLRMPAASRAHGDVTDQLCELQAGMRELDDEFFGLVVGVWKVQWRLDSIKQGVDVGPFPELPETDTMFEEVDSTWIWASLEGPCSSDGDVIHTPLG
ncbi:hypothetical protein FQN50_009317, partial [Emmonsiellopsis sp. PD_5]